MSWFDWLSIAGSFASLLGLAISLWLLREVSRLKSNFRQRIRTPQLVRSLESLLKELFLLLEGLDALDKVSSTPRIDALLSRIAAVAEEGATILSGPARQAARRAASTIRYRRLPTSLEGAWNAHHEAMELQEALAQSGKSQTWSL